MSLGADGGALVAVMCSLKIYTQPPSANQSRLFVCHSQVRYHGGNVVAQEVNQTWK